MDHQELINLLPLAALDRLDPDESRALDEHLREGCTQCEAELRAWRETAASFAAGLEPSGSEQRVWQRLEARLQAGANAARTTTPPTRRAVDRTQRHPHVLWWRGMTAAAAVAALVLLVYNQVLTKRAHLAETRHQARMESLNGTVSHLRSELATAQTETATLRNVLEERARLDRVLMSPDLQITRLGPAGPATGAGGVVALSHASRAAMVQAFGLPPTPPGKSYELWWITKQGGPSKAGLFLARKGHTAVAPAAMPPAGERVMLAAVTLEPAGGVDKPTGAIYLKGAPERE
jgi:anti-sigma-K factor RskA